MYAFKLGTLLLIGCLLVVLSVVRRQFIRSTGLNIDKYLVYALFFRIIWMIIVIYMEDKMVFFVWDDQSYYQTAIGERFIGQGAVDGEVNAYFYILRWIYDSFGRSSLNGRLLNMFASTMTLYPLAYLEYSLNNETAFRATFFFAVSPFQVFISFFEMKDIILMLSFLTSYAVLKRMVDKGANVWLVTELVLMCLLSERMRSGMGMLPVGLFLFSKVKAGFGATKYQRMFSIITCGVLCFGVAFAFLREYLAEGMLKIEKYQKWIFTQFSSSSIYNRFVITKIQDIWKLPFCFVLYAIQPLNALDGSGRFFGEWGMFAKFFDVPVLLMGLRWLFKYIRKEKINSAIFLIPYIFVSGVNLTNARQGFFLYPILYLMCFYGYETSGQYKGKSRFIALLDKKKTAQLMFMVLYFLWFLLIVTRL